MFVFGVFLWLISAFCFVLCIAGLINNATAWMIIAIFFIGVLFLFLGLMPILKSKKMRIRRYLKKRGGSPDKIGFTGHVISSYDNPNYKKYIEMLEEKLKALLPSGLAAENDEETSLLIHYDWDEVTFDGEMYIYCHLSVSDSLNKPNSFYKYKPFMDLDFSFEHEESRFVAENLLLAVITFIDRSDFSRAIKGLIKKLVNIGLLRNLDKPSNVAGQQKNVGTYYRNEAHAHDYWASQYFIKYTPVIICRFETLEQARKAILNISFISESNGALISLKTIDYGCYLNSDQKGEVIICGHGFSMAMFEEAKKKLLDAGGEIYKEQTPDEQNEPQTKESTESAAEDVAFVKNTQKELAPGVVATYVSYKASSESTAKEFLAGQTILQPLYYIVVDTPQGSWGKDCDGIYKE